MRTIIASAPMLFAALCLAGVVAVFAAEDSASAPTVSQALRSVMTISAQKCPGLKADLDKARQTEKPDMFATLAGTYRSVCICTPARIKTFRTSLSAGDLAAPFSRSDLQHRYNTEVTGQCAIEQLRTLYGSSCSQLFASRLPDSAKYCQCMSEQLSKLSARAAAALGLAYSDYLPAAADAKQKGLPAPVPAPILKKFLADERACRVP